MSSDEPFDEALEFMSGLGTCERCLLAVVSEQGLAARAARGLTKGEVEGRVAELLQEVLLGGKPRMAIDKIGGQLRSFMCVPLTDPQGQRIGILYADSRVSSGNFQYVHLGKLSEFAQDYEKRLFRQLAQPAKSETKAETSEPKRRPSPVLALSGLALSCLAALWVFVGFGVEISQAGASPSPTPLAPAPKNLTLHDPVAASRFYLSLLRGGKFESAYSLLSARLQSEVSPQSFQASVEGWLEANRGLQREPFLVEREESICRVEIRATDSDSEENSWVWSLRSEGTNGWKLDRFEGGPSLGS